MQYKFHVFGVPVYARKLSSGALAVWHPYNLTVREIIEPICRDRGYWRSGYNNWIVHARYCESVLADLAVAERG